MPGRSTAVPPVCVWTGLVLKRSVSTVVSSCLLFSTYFPFFLSCLLHSNRALPSLPFTFCSTLVFIFPPCPARRGPVFLSLLNCCIFPFFFSSPCFFHSFYFISLFYIFFIPPIFISSVFSFFFNNNDIVRCLWQLHISKLDIQSNQWRLSRLISFFFLFIRNQRSDTSGLDVESILDDTVASGSKTDSEWECAEYCLS